MWRHSPSDEEFRQEIDAHIAHETDRLIAEGLEPAAAADAARRRFGNATLVRERYYESRRFGWFDDLTQDVRFTLRSLRRSAGFTAVAVLTLAVGLGANTAIFSVVNAVLLRPLPYANPSRLVLVEHPSLGGIPEQATTAWRASTHTLEDFAGFGNPSAATLSIHGAPLQTEVAQATWKLFPLLGVAPIAGRTFQAADEASAADVAVLSHRFWVRAFAGDAAAIGQTVKLTDEAGSAQLLIVGVLPGEFQFPTAYSLEQAPLFLAGAQPDIIRLARPHAWLTQVGRLTPASTPDAARVELGGIFVQAMQRQFSPSFFKRATLQVTSLQDRLVGDARRRLLVVFGAVGCVLLVVCANVGNLLLARMSGRQSEFAVRAALGARTSRLARLMLTESVVLAGLGSVVALLLAFGTRGALRSLLAEQITYVDRIPMDWWVLAFNVGLAVAVGVVSGLLPLAGVRASGLVAAFARGGSRSVTGRSRLRQLLLSAEVALTFVLVLAAGLLCSTLWHLYHADRGYDGDRVVTAKVMPKLAGASRQIQGLTWAFFDDLTQRVSALPNVEAASAASNVPFGGVGMSMSGVTLVGDAPATGGEDDRAVHVAAVTPRYFATIGAKLTAGRDFDRTDLDGRERVAIVNEAFRRQVAPGRTVVGVPIQFGKQQLTVIGVADDLPDTSLRTSAQARVYLPLAQVLGTPFAFGQLTVLARSHGSHPDTLLPTLRQAIWAQDQDTVIDDVATMGELLSASVRKERDSAWLFGLFATIALVVAVAGIYAVVAYSVAQRTREIGIRIALGARRGRVINEIVRQTAWPVIGGLVLGVAGALMATRAIASTLFETAPTDPQTHALVLLVLAGAALAAAWIPARRAASIDPVAALRAD